MEINKHTNQFEEGKILSCINKENNFSVPPDYFEELPVQIMNRIHLGADQKKQFSLLNPSFIIPSLALFSGLIVFLIFFNKNEMPPDGILLSENEIQQIVENPEFYNINNTAITDHYIAENISEETINTENSISDDEIKAYFEANPNLNDTIINEY